MKKTMSFILILLFVISTNAQQLSIKQTKLYNDYLPQKKSNQTLGWICIGGGAALALGGLAVYGSNQSYVSNETIGTIMMVGGGAAVVTGIIILSTSGKNAKKESVFLNLKMENAAVLHQTTIINNHFPAAAFKMRID